MQRFLSNALPPLVTLVVVLAVWHYLTANGTIPSFLLPPPESVFTTLWSGLSRGTFWPHIGYTLTSVLIGYVLGSVGGILLGVIVAESRLVERLILPYVIGMQSVPKVALAPLILVWFGFGIESKIALVTLICFFPVLVNTIVGMRRADPEMVDMCHSFSKGWAFIFRHVKLPAAASSIFAGLQIGVALSLIGAVVGEFMASQRGLGFLIGSATASMDVSLMFAGVLILAAIGMVGNALVSWAHYHVVFWEGRTTLVADAEG